VWHRDADLANLPAPSVSVTLELKSQDVSPSVVDKYKDDMRLIGAIELVSPRNKDRKKVREPFVRKCHSYLKGGIGLVLIDIVTYRKPHLHNQLMDFLGGPLESRLPVEDCYATSYRVTEDQSGQRLEAWNYHAALGQPIPSVPMCLLDGPCITLNLEATYTEALADLNL
jgi:hypothetical protein